MPASKGTIPHFYICGIIKFAYFQSSKSKDFLHFIIKKDLKGFGVLWQRQKNQNT